MKLKRDFYARNTELVAKQLLGKILACKTSKGICKGKIVETEAYFGSKDPASHAWKITPRSKIMLGKPGTAYVYFTYGNHFMFNAVTEKLGKPGAVLIRAIEPIKGIKLMQKRRGIKEIKKLCSGPGKLTKSLGITKSQNGLDLTKSSLYIETGQKESFQIVRTKRIGIKRGKEKLLRFYIKGNEFVSKR